MTGYKIEYGTDGSTWTVASANTASSTTAYSLSGLTNGTSYFVRVSGISQAGVGIGLVGTGTPAVKSSAPGSLTALSASGQITLTWTAPTTTGGGVLSGYAIQTSTDGTTWVDATTNTGTTTTSITLNQHNGSSLVPNTIYYARVAAVANLGVGDYTAAVQALLVQTVSAVDTLTATAGDQLVVLAWTAATGSITGYKIEKSTTGTSWTTLATVGTSTLTYTATGLTDGTWYYFRVSTTSTAGDKSSVIAAKPVQTPDAPTNVIASASGNNSVALSWTAPTNTGGSAIQFYSVDVSSDSGLTWTSVSTSIIGTAYSFTNATPGSTLTFRVAAITAVGTGPIASSGPVTVLTLPDVPTGLVITPLNGSLGLSWTAPSQAVFGYKIEHSTDGAAWTVDASNTNGQLTTFTINSLTNGTNYFVRISGINGAGTGIGLVGGATPATTAGAPTSLNATGGVGSITLTWSAPASNGGSSITGYKIDSSLNGTTWDTVTASTLSTATSINVNSVSGSPLVAGTNYQFRVSAITALGVGSTSATASATPILAVSTVDSLTATAANAQVNLSWHAASGSVSGYLVEISSTGSVWTTLTTTNSATTSYTASGLSNGTWYYFRVSASSSAGQGASSVIAAKPMTTPGVPTAVTATGILNGVALSWTAPASTGGSSIVGYKIESSSDAGTTWIVVNANTGNSGTSINLNSVSGTVQYRVSAINAVGAGAPSAGATATSVPALPGAVATLTLTPANTSITATWTAASGALSDYLLEKSADGGNTWSSQSVAAGTTTIALSGLTNGANYLIRVAGRNAAGIGTAAIGTSIPRTTPGSPAGLAATSLQSVATLTWQAPVSTGGATLSGYEIDQSSDGGSTWTILYPNTHTSGTSISFAVASGTYQYRVAAITQDSTGTLMGSYSNAATLSAIQVVTGITNLTGVAHDQSVALSWTAALGATSYKVEQMSIGTWSTIAAAITAPSFTATGLTNGSVYYYRVTAFNSAGSSAAVTTAITPFGQATAPSGLTANAYGANILLSWTAPTNLNGAPVLRYAIYVNGSSTAVLTTSTTTKFNFVTPTAGSYSFTVAAVTGSPAITASGVSIAENSLTGLLSASATATSSASPAGSTLWPVAIAGISMNPRVAGHNPSVHVTWTAPTNVTPADYLLQIQSAGTLGTSASLWQALHLVSGTTVVGLAGTDMNETMVATAFNSTTFSADVDGICSVTINSYVQNGGCPTFTPFASTPYVFQVSAYTGNAPMYLKASKFSRMINSVTSGSGNTGSFTFAQIQDVPSQVARPSAMAVGPNQIAVAWPAATDNGSPITQYTPTVHIMSAANVETVDTLTATINTSLIYNATGATTDQYSFCVVATNAIGDSPVSLCSTAIYAVNRPTTVASGLTASLQPLGGASSTPVKLDWVVTDSSTVTGWVVQHSIDGVNWIDDALINGGSTNTYTATGLQAGTPVSFRIAAMNQAGSGTFVSTTATPLGTPDSPILTAKSGTSSAFLYWTPPQHLNGRTIAQYVLTDGNNASVAGCTNLGLATSCTVTGLINEQQYSFVLAAQYFDVVANDTKTVTSSASVTPAAAPAKPTQVSAPVEASGSVTISWSASAPGANEGTTTGFYIQQLDVNGLVIAGSDFTDSSTVGTQTHTFTGLTNGTTYRWQIFATNANGGVKSTAPLFISATPKGIPGDVTGLILIPSSQRLDISWTAPANDGGSPVTSYQVAVTQNGSSVTATSCNALVNSCSLTGLTNGQAVTVSVLATTAIGQSAHAVTSTATPNDVSAPVTALAYTSPSTKTIALTWSAPSGATSFTIERGETVSNAIVWTILANNSTNVSGYTDSVVPADGINYFYKVTPSNGNTFGQASVILAISQGPASAVQNLAGNAGDSQITVTWSAPANNGGSAISGYRVEYATASAPNVWTTFIANSASTATNASITGLTNSTPYIVRVEAINGYGVGLPGTPTSAITPQAVPGSVTNVIATPGTGANVGSVTVTWDAQVGATGYLVQSKGSVGAAWIDACNITNGATTTCTVYGLIAGHTYYFLVTAINGSGSGSGTQASVQTNTLAATSTTLPTILGQVANLAAVQESGTNSDKVDLAWSALTGADTYTVSVQGSAGSAFIPVTCASAVAPFCVVAGLIGGYTYTFQVLPFGHDSSNQYGQGVVAQVSLALPVYVPPAPAAGGGSFAALPTPAPLPLPLSATSMTAKGGDRQVQLTWVAPGDSNRSNWEIEQSLDGSTWVASLKVSGSATTAAIGSLKNGTNYIFRLLPSGQGGKNLPVVASAMPGIAAAAPLGFTAAPGDSSVILSWTAPADSGGLPIKNYVVEQSTDGTTWSQVSSVDGTTLSAYVAGLTNFSQYNFRVAAVTDFGKGTPATLTASPSVLPTAPLQLHLVSVGPGVVTVGWNPVTGGSASTISGYKVEYSADGKVWTSSSTTTASATSAAVTGLTNGKTYQIRVSPVTSTGVGASSIILGTPATTPDAVTAIVATPSSGKMTLTFAQPKNTGGYGIDYYIGEVAENANGPWTVAVPNSGSALTRVDIPGLKNGKTYYYRITAVNQIGNGPVSAVVNAVPGAAATAPALQTFGITPKAANITWAVPTDTGGKAITKYIVEVSADGVKWTVAVTTAAGKRAAAIPLTKKAQLMRVRAVTSYGNGVPSLGVRLPGTGK